MAEDILALGVEIRAFDVEDARAAPQIWARAPRAGLAMGDRACLAPAERSGRPAVITDRTSERLDLGVEVLVLRLARRPPDAGSAKLLVLRLARR